MQSPTNPADTAKPVPPRIGVTAVDQVKLTILREAFMDDDDKCAFCERDAVAMFRLRLKLVPYTAIGLTCAAHMPAGEASEAELDRLEQKLFDMRACTGP